MRQLATSLHANTALRQLALDRNLAGDRGAFAIAEALPANKTLTELELRANNIKTEGTGLRLLINNIKIVTHDRYLGLDFLPILEITGSIPRRAGNWVDTRHVTGVEGTPQLYLALGYQMRR